MVTANLDTSPAEPALRFNNVDKRYGGDYVLRQINFEIGVGALCGLVGLNGAGKTTLIKCLLDFCEIESGTVEIHGIDHRNPASRLQLSFLPERFVPPYFLLGRQYMRIATGLALVPYEEADTRKAFALLGLEEGALDKPVRAFSKGMTQKLGLAGCLLSKKNLFVLDEPLSGLDPKARALLKTQLLSLRARGATLLMTSHSLADIEEICDHMLVLHDGRIAYSGTPSSFCALYAVEDLEEAFLTCIEGNHG